MDTQQLTELEARTYRNAYDDGLWDILLGLYLIVSGIGISLGMGFRAGWLGGVAGGLAFPLWVLLRKTITGPRVGYVRLHPSRRARLRRNPFIVIALILLIVAFGVWISQFGKGPGSSMYPGLVFSIPLAVAGYLFEIRRGYVYAALLMLERALDSLTGGPYDWVYWPSGLAMAGSGLFVLARFLRRYPKGNGANVDA